MIFEIVVLFLAIIILLALSAFFSGSETALTASTRSRLTGLAMKGKGNANIAIELLNKKESLIGAILLGNNLVNILASALATSLLIRVFGNSGVAYAVIIMTALIVIFAEILPKSYAIANSEKAALMVSPYLKPFVTILAPITWLMEKTVFYILSLIGIKHDKNARTLSVADEIRGTVDLHHKEGRLFKMDKDMVKGILDLSEITVEDIMVHRSNIFTVNIDDLPEKIISQVAESPYTRIPVWKDNNENIIGLIHSKNLLKILKDRQSLEITREEIKNSLIKTWFVPETTSLKDQLQMHLKRKIKLAMVVDEYGALNGMISLEDIIEEIVGDISDEHDIDMSDITQDKDGSIKVKGSTEIRNLNRSFGWDLPDEEANTISGLIINESRSFPKIGQEFQFYGFKFKIIEAEKNIITKVIISSLN
ncbi:HlyC/CorC family transporter [Pelagibacteraceae bacterium]|nr:HlyC/CorC family transporter [Pelagibacteraceae bacterium]